jgi:CubicO group peptidase (beta-lactamase class C family)
MDSTDTILTPDLAARFATGYRAYGGEFGKARLIQFNDFWDPNGGIYSTPHDMIRYTAAAMGLCPSALSDACTVSELPFALREERPQLLLQGLLWEIMPLPDGTALIMKTGETNAFQTQMIFSRPYKKGVLVFINTAYLGEGPRISSIALSIMEKMLPDRSFSSVNG